MRRGAGRRVWLAAVSCAVVLVAAVAPAIAEGIEANLLVSPSAGYYGQNAILSPSVGQQVRPGDLFEFQVWSRAEQEWVKYQDSDQAVEETGVVQPLWHIYDNSLKYPAYFRTVFRTKASGLATIAVSPTERLEASQFSANTVRVSAPSRASVRTQFTASVRVLQNVGEGTVRARVYRRVDGAWKRIATRDILTDDLGVATIKIRPSKRGLYLIRAQFLGNQFSVPSAVAAKVFVAR